MYNKESSDNRFILYVTVIIVLFIVGILLLPLLNEQQLLSIEAPISSEQLTLAENEQGYRVFVDALDVKDDSYPYVFVESPSGVVKSFDWGQRFYEEDFPPIVELVKMPGSDSEQLLIVLTQEHGAGSFKQEAYLLQANDLTEIQVQDPLEYVMENTSSTIAKKDGQVLVDLKVKEDSYPFTFQETDAGVWNEILSFGYILTYSLEKNVLIADIPAIASVGGLSVGSVKLEYKLVDGNLSITGMKFVDTNSSESEGAILSYTSAIAEKNTDVLVYLYGGSYDWIAMFSPEADREDKYKVFENYLQVIGEPITFGDILEKTEVNKDEFIYVVTFKREDGTLFDVGTTESRTNTFTYTVKRMDGYFKVMEPPPYQA